ncbi:ATP-binding protein [Halomonas sp. TRM85114]|uniref:ATP-binding protein n=1 Tax=Halomonas jincaotanensis TaxID=2810616 RepID=UPI001BD5285E|nr:ATP-binding protein [Halomonas jincaotanensis]MBS9405344.1 ATP-binding protein [Halomonas jincaotanensis]
MSGLKAIILFNSYLKGLKTRLPCEGHTNLGGDNGVGKTSALKLLPIFLGQEPSKVMERSANKSSFVDYYLPNYQSMVIFEYDRLNGDTCCAVFYRPRSGDGQGHAHRFVLGSADDTIFNSSLNDLYARQEEVWSILRHGLKDVGAYVSQQHLRTSHYRDVISNTAHLTRRQKGSNKTASLRVDARRFSLGGLEDKLQHMHELTSVTMDNNRLTSRLKKMIIDTQIRDKVHLQEARPNADNASTWRDIDSLRSFWQARSDLMAGIDIYTQVMEARHEIASRLHAMNEHLSQVQERMSQNNELLSQNKRKREEHEETFDEHQRQAKSQLSTLKSEKETLERDINALYDERDRWEEKVIDDIAIRYENLPQLRQHLTSLRETLDVLRKQGEEIEASYDNQRSAAFERFHRRLEPLQNDKEKLAGVLGVLQRQHDEDIQTLNRQLEKEARRVSDEIDEEIQLLQEQNIKLTDSLDNARQPTPEETSTRDSSLNAIRHAEQVYEKATHEFQACQTAIQAASEQLIKEERRLSQAEADLKVVEATRDTLLKSRHAEDGTLLAYLREHFPDWGDSLGKVIAVDLLQRKDLQPQLVGEEKTLFGLELDLTALSKPDEALEESQLDRLLSDAAQAVRLCKASIGTVTDEVKRARQVHTEQVQQRVVFGNRQASEKERLKSLKEADQALAVTHREAADRRQQAICYQIKDVTDQISQATQQKKARRNAFEQQAQKARIDLKAEQSEEVAHQTYAIEQKEALIQAAKESHEAHLKALKRTLDDALAEKGIDTKVRDAAKQAVDEAAADIEFLESKKEEIAQYQHWRRYQYPAVENKSQSLREVESQIDSQEKALVTLTQESEKTLAQLKAARNELKKNNNDLSRKEQAWRNLIEQGDLALARVPNHGDTQPLIAPQHLGEGEQVAQHLDMLSREIIKKTDALRRVSDKCRGIINEHPNTQVHQAWQHMYQRLIEDDAFESHSVELAIASMKALSDLMNDRLPEIERVLTQEVRAIADRMVKYRSTLKNLNNKINSVSRELKTKLNTEHDFPAISDIQVQLVSLISQDDQWKPLTSFAEQWVRWLARHETSLPDDALMAELRQLDEAYRNTRGGSGNVDDLVDIEIQLRENERTVPIRNDKDFSDSSSAGLSLMALLIIFSALTRYLCPNEKIAITWPIDELSKIDPQNIQRLFAMMQRRNIHIFCAQPKATPETLRRFDNRIMLDKGKGAMIVIDDESEPLNPRFADALKALEARA